MISENRQIIIDRGENTVNILKIMLMSQKGSGILVVRELDSIWGAGELAG